MYFNTSLINPFWIYKLDGKHNYKTFNCIFYTLKKLETNVNYAFNIFNFFLKTRC